MKKQRFFVPPAIIILLTLILYANTLSHKYALDDSMVITENQFTKKGLSGIKEIFTNDSFTGFFKTRKDLVQGGRYRPLSLATFAVEYHFFGEKPFVSHLVNILLYALTGIMIWLILTKIPEDLPESAFQISLPLFTALLFIFHPLHTEVVANIKGRDEILALLFSLAAMNLAIKYTEKPKAHLIVLASLCFFLALLSKESAITFLILIPLALIFFKIAGIKKIVLITFFLTVAVLIYLIIRVNVIGGFKSVIPAELMNNPFLNASPVQKYATIIYTLGAYFKLLVFPHPLTFDYYPYHIGIQDWNPLTGIILVLYLVLLLLAVFLTLRGIRKKLLISLLAFAVIYYLLTLFLVSNIPFNMGTFMNERFIYFSSLAFCIILAWLIIALSMGFRSQGYFKMICLSVILLLYGYKTIDRNKAWKDNYTLFTTDVKTSQNSAKSNCSAGGVIYEASLSVTDLPGKEQMLRKASAYLRRAVSIHDKYVDAWQLLGNVSYEEGNYEQALDCYLKVFEINPNDTKTWQNVEVVLNKYDSIDKKILICEQLLQIDSSRYSINYILGNLYGKHKNDLPGAIKYLSKAYHINPQSFEVCKDLGVAWGLSGEFNQSVEWFRRALTLNPDDADTYINLGITYHHLGDVKKFNQYIKKGEELKQRK
ncbi:MAG TPA: tetratricopeptide repeat protein [Bacteroidales bacterium]|nr:tetratricopeptide repeat protein [Bacteroidales bacterium]